MLKNLTKNKLIIRLIILSFLRNIFISRFILSIPKSKIYIKDIKEGNDVFIYNCLQVEEKIDNLIPVGYNLDIQNYPQFNLLISKCNLPCFVLKASNYFVWGNQGCVLNEKREVIFDLSREFDSKIHSIFLQYKIPQPKYLSGNVVLLAAPGSNVYYHWMVDIVPRIQMLSDLNLLDKMDTFILYYEKLPFQMEVLKAFGINEDKILNVKIPFSFHAQVQNLYVSSYSSELDTVSFYAINSLKKLFLKDCSIPDNKTSRIYLKRKNGRTFVNEIEIENALKDFGFIFCVLENYTISEQANLFYGADVIIGPHGSGFTNIVFCRPNTIVIDIFSPNWINACFYSIAYQINLRYNFLVGDNLEINSSISNKAQNINLDVNKLIEFFENQSIYHLN